LVDTLQRAGHLAVAPVLTEQFRIYGQGVSHPPASTWSERHILYAAGMGTFGLSDGFITARGIAMRCGSVVCDLPLRPSPRRSPNHTANCLYLSKGACGACIDRCPAAAISPQGHDKLKCQDYTYGWARSLSAIYGVGILGCGLCQTGVPCEDRIPTEV
jgi:epoxyqueuosine reductase QueG